MAESVWDYPRPPRIEKTSKRLVVEAGGQVIADTTRGVRVLETSHPPTYYIPMDDVEMALLRLSSRRSVCEFKGEARYYDLVAGGSVRPAVAWFYPQPWSGFEALRDHLSFFASRVDACAVDGEAVFAQEGDFYGGWITADLVGPFKGAPGTLGW